jgi:pyocin large subunit-like protein
VPFTRGFDPLLLGEHFDKHKHEFGVTTEEEYEERADAFLGGPFDATTMMECTDSKGDYIRYNRVTSEFAVVTRANIIRTYFKLRLRRHKRMSDLMAFRARCNE